MSCCNFFVPFLYFLLSIFLFLFFPLSFWLGLSRKVELLIAGLAIKVCLYDDTEEKIFYTEDDYRSFLSNRGWSCLREFDGYRNIDNMDDLRPGAIYRGMSWRQVRHHRRHGDFVILFRSWYRFVTGSKQYCSVVYKCCSPHFYLLQCSGGNLLCCFYIQALYWSRTMLLNMHMFIGHGKAHYTNADSL